MIDQYERNARGGVIRHDMISDSGASYYHEAYINQFTADSNILMS